jgi:hypothetical protein
MKTGYNSLDNGCKGQQQRVVQDVVYTDMCKQTSGMWFCLVNTPNKTAELASSTSAITQTKFCGFIIHYTSMLGKGNNLQDITKQSIIPNRIKRCLHVYWDDLALSYREFQIKQKQKLTKCREKNRENARWTKAPVSHVQCSSTCIATVNYKHKLQTKVRSNLLQLASATLKFLFCKPCPLLHIHQKVTSE